MQAIYQHSWKWFLVAIFMVPTAYGQGETTLVANFANGNTNFFRSRIYLWNPSSSDASITIRVFSLTQSGPSELLGTANLDLIEAETARNIRLEDIFVSIGLQAPYEQNNGNITLEFKVGADNVRGSAQVFDNSLSLAFGTYPLQVISATGTNTTTGSGALQNNTTGTENTANGYQALFSNTTGLNNTAMGKSALQANTTGSNNSAMGAGALFNNIAGRDNTASGWLALFNNTGGSFNTASGMSALNSNTFGLNNTATGWLALSANITGSSNTAVGESALKLNTTGSNNIALGSEAGFNATTGDNNIYIGNRGVAAESNTIRIGDSADHSSAFIAGVQVGPASSRRFKEDIHDMGTASTNLMRLRPVTFHYKKEYDAGDGHLQYGLIAEEVAEVYPELVQYVDGKAKTVLYQQLPAIMLNELQKQHRQVQELTEWLARLEQVLTAQQTLAALKVGQ